MELACRARVVRERWCERSSGGARWSCDEAIVVAVVAVVVMVVAILSSNIPEEICGLTESEWMKRWCLLRHGLPYPYRIMDSTRSILVTNQLRFRSESGSPPATGGHRAGRGQHVRSVLGPPDAELRFQLRPESSNGVCICIYVYTDLIESERGQNISISPTWTTIPSEPWEYPLQPTSFSPPSAPPKLPTTSASH